MSIQNKDEILTELETLLNFNYVSELWVVGSAVEPNSTFTSTSDIDIICHSSALNGEINEFTNPTDDESKKLLQNPEQVWGHASEGVELDYTIPVQTNTKLYNATVHLIAQPIDYDVTKIDGNEVQIYPK